MWLYVKGWRWLYYYLNILNSMMNHYYVRKMILSGDSASGISLSIFKGIFKLCLENVKNIFCEIIKYLQLFILEIQQFIKINLVKNCGCVNIFVFQLFLILIENWTTENFLFTILSNLLLELPSSFMIEVFLLL